MEIIEEKLYQKIKKEMNKTDDYFTEGEIKQLVKIGRENYHFFITLV